MRHVEPLLTNHHGHESGRCLDHSSDPERKKNQIKTAVVCVKTEGSAMIKKMLSGRKNEVDEKFQVLNVEVKGIDMELMRSEQSYFELFECGCKNI